MMTWQNLPPGKREEVREIIRAAERGDAEAAAYLNQPYRFTTQSPLESDLVWAIADLAGDRIVPEVYEDQRDFFIRVDGRWEFRLETQARVGAYTADILLSSDALDLRVAVECDGHEFHEKTKAQAEHDKRRDRYFQEHGYTVLRFTGSEIHRDCDAVAEEVLRIVAGMAYRAEG